MILDYWYFNLNRTSFLDKISTILPPFVYRFEIIKKKFFTDHNVYGLTVITSRGNKYNADKFIESKSFELKSPRCIIQISSLIPFGCMFVIVRLKINLGIEYSADVTHTPSITSLIKKKKEEKIQKMECLALFLSCIINIMIDIFI